MLRKRLLAIWLCACLVLPHAVLAQGAEAAEDPAVENVTVQEDGEDDAGSGGQVEEGQVEEDLAEEDLHEADLSDADGAGAFVEDEDSLQEDIPATGAATADGAAAEPDGTGAGLEDREAAGNAAASPADAGSEDLAGEAVPETLEEDAPEAFGEDAPEALEEAVPEAFGEDAPEALGEDVPETLEEDAQKAFGEDASEALEEEIPKVLVEDAAPESVETPALAEAAEDYGVSIRSDGHIVVCPGEEVVLEADAWHWTADGVIRDGFLYKWEIVSIETTGAGNGTLSFKDGIEGQIGDYPSATMTFGGVPDKEACDRDEQNFEYIARVRVTLYDGTDASGDPVERASAEFDGIALKDEYYEITPHEIDCLRIGESTTVPFRFIYYSYYIAGGYGDVTELSWRFVYNDEVLEVTDSSGNAVDPTGERSLPSTGDETPVTIRRIAQGDSEFEVTAVFTYIDHNRTVHYSDTYTEGFGRFFGSLDGEAYPLWFEDHDVDLFTDADPAPALVLETEGLGDGWQEYLDLAVTVGHWDDDGWKDLLGQDQYGIETGADGRVYVTLTEACLEGIQAGQDWDNLRVYVAAYPRDWAQADDNRLSDTDAWFHVGPVREDYDREWDRDMLPGWDGTVQGTYNCRVENSAHPNGEDIRYKVKDVRIVRDAPAEGEDGDVITDFHRDQDENDESNYWWYYRAERRGEADLQVTYEDVEGNEQSYTFTLHVGGDVYSVCMDSAGRERDALPGGAIELYADAAHEYLDENGDCHKDADSLGYAWSFEYGGEFADIEVHADDPSRATLRFHDLPEGQDWINEGVRVGVRILNAAGEETGGYDSIGLYVCSEYTVVAPLLFDQDMELGASIEDQAFETRRYRIGQEGYTVLDGLYGIRYEWHYDENALLITEKRDGEDVEIHDGGSGGGNTFTILRRGNWSTDFSVRAVWTDEDGNERDVWQNYQFRERNYDFWFENGEDEICDDQEKSFAIDDRNLGNFAGGFFFTVDYRAVDDKDSEAGQALLQGLTEREDYVLGDDGKSVYLHMREGEEYEVNPDGRSITVNGDRVERTIRKSNCADAQYKNEFYIGAFLTYGEKTLATNWCMVRLERTGKSIQEIAADDVAITMYDAPALAVTGAKGSLAFAGSDETVVKVDPATGRLTPVGLGTARVTVRAAATDDYRIGETACTVTVGKLDLADTGVKVTTNAPAAGYTYNGKAQKPSAVSVIYTNTEGAAVTLAAGTDYSLSWPKGMTGAGTYALTATGKGKCAGKASATFMIDKAAQSVTVKASAASLAVGKTATVTLTGAQGAKSYKSSNTAVATVNSAGKVTAKKVGSVTITATSAATANYKAASKAVTIKVVPAATTRLAAQNLAGGVKLTWARVTGATGYYVYRSGQKVKTISKNATVTWTDTAVKAKNGTKYVYKVVPYATIGKKAVASTAAPKTLAFYRLTGVALSSAANTGKNTMTVRWKAKNTKGTGYEIQYGLKSSFAGARTATVSKASALSQTLKGLTRGKTYYVRIRAVKKVGKTTYASAWSAAKKVKIVK